MSIINIGKYFFPVNGGVEIVTQKIHELFIKNNIDSTVVSFDKKIVDKEVYKIGKIKRYRAFKIGPAPVSIRYLLDSVKLFKNSDIILIHYPNPIAEISRILFFGKKYTIIFHHGDLMNYNRFLEFFYRKMTRMIFKKTDKIICTSPNISKSSPTISEFPEKIEILSPSVNTDIFFPDENKKNEKYRFFKKSIIYVGRLARTKGIKYLIESLEYLDDDFGLVIIGKGEEKDELSGEVSKRGFEKRVIFVGESDNEKLPFYYINSDVFVLPSFYESFGIVSIEAMACGIPVVTTELGTGTSYYNKDGETGKIISPKNSKEIANAVNFCYENKERLGKNASETVKKFFSDEAFEKKLMDIVKRGV